MSRQEHSPSFTTRLRVVLSLLAALRWRDICSARQLMKTRFGQYPMPLRLFKLLCWSVDAMWRQIPESMAWVQLDENISHTPYWLSAENPLENHPWAREPGTSLPESADVVVVGAGFGGASVAYHWSRQGSENLVVLERGEAANGAAGRNGGIVVMAGGIYHGFYVYEPVLEYLKATRADMSAADRDELAASFAAVYVRAVQASHESIEATIRAEGIDCDYARRGWVFFVDTQASKKLEASLALGSRLGHSDWVRRAPGEVRRRSGAATELDGAESLASATWHPAKWVWSILEAALRKPHVSLFTRTEVNSVRRDGENYIVRTPRGAIRARCVVNATEAHTSTLFKDFLTPFPDLIRPHKEQGMYGEGGPPSMAPRVGISGYLGWYVKVASGGIVFGSDHTPVAPSLAGKTRPSRFITRYTAADMEKHWDPEPMRVTREWTGTTAQSPDKFPLVGLLDGRGLYMLGGFAGAGSAVSFNAGETLVRRMLGKQCDPDYHPEEFFSPLRFTDPARYGRRPQG